MPVCLLAIEDKVWYRIVHASVVNTTGDELFPRNTKRLQSELEVHFSRKAGYNNNSSTPTNCKHTNITFGSHQTSWNIVKVLY